jgi:glucose/arabinose dehydrogenase
MFLHRGASRPATIASALLAAASLLSFASGTAAMAPTTPRHGEVAGLKPLVGGLQQPVFVTNAGDARLFVVQRTGKIVIVKNVSGTWKIAGTFLDISGSIDTDDGEQGLLGLAFSPRYATTGLFYIYFVNRAGNEVIAEYHRASASKADPSSKRVLLTIKDPYPNHNGGWIAFRPGEPYLYAAEGDGGSAGDPQNRAQNIHVLFGKILRIDPGDPDGTGPKRYGIPPSNPFVGKDGRDEIYAYGLRNPWRDSFDPKTGDLWIGDVGQDSYEEVDHVRSGNGLNFGWNEVEGRHLYPSGSLCHTNCHTLPVIEYPHSDPVANNCAVIGGYVSRRSGAPLYGRYVFGDDCSGRIWNVPATFHGTHLPAPIMSGYTVSSFGVGHNGRLYVLDLGGTLSVLTGS